MTSVTIHLPAELPSSLHCSRTELENDVKVAAAIDWSRQGAVSQSRAAGISGGARPDFIEARAERKIDVFSSIRMSWSRK